MSAWAATAIRLRFPDAEIVWAIESRCSPVAEVGRLASRLHEFPRDRWKRERWSPRTWREQLVAYSALRRTPFDFGVDLQGHSKTALCLRIANPKRRIAARSTDPLARRLNPTLDEPADLHTVEWNHKVICRFADFELPERPIMPTMDATPDPKLVTIAVGAGSRAKEYTLEGWREVARMLGCEGLHVRVLGGPTDPPFGDGAEDLVGKLSLSETMAEVASSRIHLAADTGTGHIAAAYGVPTVSIFGPTSPAKYRPYTPNGQVIRASSNPADVHPDEIVSAARSLILASMIS